MLQQVNVQEKKVNFEFSLHNSFGGVIGYSKLLAQLWHQIYTSPLFSRLDRFRLSFVLILKSPWYLIIKPWGFLFKTHTKYTGSVKAIFYDAKLHKYNFSETNKIFYITFLKIPCFYYQTKNLNSNDESVLLDKFIYKK